MSTPEVNAAIEQVTAILARSLPATLAAERARNVLASVILGCDPAVAVRSALGPCWAMQGHVLGASELAEVVRVLQPVQGGVPRD